MKKLFLLLALPAALALAGQFAIYPGSKLVPPMSSPTADVYMTHDAYDTVVAYYTKTGKIERTMDKGGKRTMFSFDGGAEMVVWEMKPEVVSISVKKKK
jgi:hypothetical protein